MISGTEKITVKINELKQKTNRRLNKAFFVLQGMKEAPAENPC